MLFVPICYSHHRKEIHPASIHPFWARIHAMPGSKAVIVLKATRPTASCLERWVEHQERARRKPGLNSKRWYSSTQSWRRLLLGGQKKRGLRGGEKSFGINPWVCCCCCCFQSQRKSTHCFYLEGNWGPSMDTHPACSGFQATSVGLSPVCHCGS